MSRVSYCTILFLLLCNGCNGQCEAKLSVNHVGGSGARAIVDDREVGGVPVYDVPIGCGGHEISISVGARIYKYSLEATRGQRLMLTLFTVQESEEWKLIHDSAE